MKRTKWLFLVLIGAITFVSEAGAMPAQVILIRHGEKPAVGNDLNTQGYARANALPAFFKNNLEVNQFGPIAAVYAMASLPGHSSRPIETISPSAQALGLSVLSAYTKDETQALANEVMNESTYQGKTVVICWAHDQIPEIASFLGLLNHSAWDGSNIFDRAWVLRFSGSGRVSFQDIGEHVLPGDSSKKVKKPIGLSGTEPENCISSCSEF